MEIGKINLFTQASGMQAINPTKAVGGQSSTGVNGSSKSNNNPFGSGNTVGINTNLQTGDTVYTAAQAGKEAGVSRLLGIA